MIRATAVVSVLALAFPYGAAVASARTALASVPPHVVALANALAAHPLPASALPARFRNAGCGLRDPAIPCPVHISRYYARYAVIYYLLLARKPGQAPQEVTLIYRIYARRSAARSTFRDTAYPPSQANYTRRNARATAALKPYVGLLVDEFALFPLPRSASHDRCYRPDSCWTTRAWALVGNVIVSANAGLGLRTGNAAEAIKLAQAGIQHLLEVERRVK